MIIYCMYTHTVQKQTHTVPPVCMVTMMTQEDFYGWFCFVIFILSSHFDGTLPLNLIHPIEFGFNNVKAAKQKSSKCTMKGFAIRWIQFC